MRRPEPVGQPAVAPGKTACAECTERPDHLRAPARRPTLTAREIEVLVNWLKQENKSSTGKTLYITASTVRTHLQRIRQKYADVDRPAPTKMSLAVRAIQDGFIDVDDL